MFGLKKMQTEISTLTCEIVLLTNKIEQLRQMNENAIINREVIAKFIDDMHKIVSITAIQEAKKENEIKKKDAQKNMIDYLLIFLGACIFIGLSAWGAWLLSRGSN